MRHNLAAVPGVHIPRSSFDRSHRYLTTFDADQLIPVFMEDVIPGDTFSVGMDFFARLATPYKPVMDNAKLCSYFFFVPYRLVWQNFEKFNGAQDNPDDSIDFTIPVFSTSGNVLTGSLADYFGIPINLANAYQQISCLPFRAYNLIWNDWFRDQNLQDGITVNTDDGPDIAGDYAVMNRGKAHDYFTSCLPWPQKGDSVQINIGTSAPVHGLAINDPTATSGNPGAYRYGEGESSSDWTDFYGPDNVYFEANPATGRHGVFADLSSATGATINDWRLAFQTQRLLERDARSGTRYPEMIFAHFGVVVPDFRVQRPEFLGGGKTRININAVAQTSGQPTPASTDKLGELAAIGTVSGHHGFSKSFVEHGCVIGLVCVAADLTYSQGIERYWSKRTRYDFFLPVLAQIGEQSVLNKEIYYQNSPGTGATDDDGVFGYQERYAEYRWKPSKITGLFRPTATSSLDVWHWSEEFTSLPNLGDTFIQSSSQPVIDRTIQIPSEPQFILDCDFRFKAARPMPMFGVPGNLDRF